MTGKRSIALQLPFGASVTTNSECFRTKACSDVLVDHFMVPRVHLGCVVCPAQLQAESNWQGGPRNRGIVKPYHAVYALAQHISHLPTASYDYVTDRLRRIETDSDEGAAWPCAARRCLTSGSLDATKLTKMGHAVTSSAMI
ncbi:hypothetical protein BKA67DRAFT_530277 [Truncatella angustata]|uniref:Uncharacterized protein n=1 Tax=Truncatella angustata TaxID=152316 RepID=A0A9P8UX50_9PEZI|nr:uncharacterized protein BKA67DRAFT_530277 [Truncatella angustata]KAH6660161.1 hypothetical protein BKA67DRAFT_530277 [Truncatella angustata]